MFLYSAFFYRKTELRIVPFRESKLTQLFQNFFVGKGQCAGQGRVMLLVNVSPASNVFDETLQVLKFSAIANQVCIYFEALNIHLHFSFVLYVHCMCITRLYRLSIVYV